MHETHEYLKPSSASYQHFSHLEEPQRIYAATVADMDGGVGWLLDDIEVSGRGDNTFIVFWSDK
jgi:arylsulfatase A-like enzyme